MTSVYFIQVVTLQTSDFWSGLCGMKVYSTENKTAVLGYSDDQVIQKTQKVANLFIRERLNLLLSSIGTALDYEAGSLGPIPGWLINILFTPEMIIIILLL